MKFGASYQIRAGIRDRSTKAEGETAEQLEAPTIDEIELEVKTAIEARWPGFEASVSAERLDRD